MTIWLWIGFVFVVLVFLAIDLGVFHRDSRKISTREATIWTLIWIGTALLFNVGVYYLYEYQVMGIGAASAGGDAIGGGEAALEFLTGYVIEKSLSLDNIFVIALIFAYFGVPLQFQHRVLFYGILGALVMRGGMILIGAALIERFTWVTYAFGGLLVITALRMLSVDDEKVEPEKNPLVKFARLVFPVSPALEGEKFFTRVDGKRAITPLFLVLLVVESSDLLFAIDSIPAIFAITHEPFLVFTSNVFAILGLRSMYFVLASILETFRHLKTSLVFVLLFVGAKMLLAHQIEIPTGLSLGIIALMLVAGLLASLIPGQQVHEHPFPTLDAAVTAVRRQTKKLIVALIGITVILIGIAMIVLPGPATVVIPAGLAILGTEFLWARRLLERSKVEALKLYRKATGGGDGENAQGEPGDAVEVADASDKANEQ